MRIADRFKAGSLLHGASWSFGLRLCDVGLGWVLSVILARFLGVEQFGLYSFALSICLVLALPAQFGLPPLIVRETSRALAEDDPGRILAIKRWAYARALRISLPIVVIALAVILVLPDLLDKSERPFVLAGLMLIVVLPFAEIRSSLLRGMNRIAQSQLANSIVRPALMLPMTGAVVAAWHWNERPELLVGVLPGVVVMAMHVLAACGAWLVGVRLLNRAMRGQPKLAERAPLEIRSWRSSIVSFGLANGMYVVDAQLGILLIGLFLDGAAAGPYKVAMQGAALVSLGYAATNAPLTPKIARAWAEGNTDVVRRLVKRGSGFAMLFALPIALAFFLFGGPLIGFVFGADFTGAALPLAILTAGQLCNCAFGSATALLIMTHHEKYNTLAFGVAVVANVAMGLILIPSMGPTGAAIAAASSVLVRNCVLWICAKKLLGIDTGFWARLPREG